MKRGGRLGFGWRGGEGRRGIRSTVAGQAILAQSTSPKTPRRGMSAPIRAVCKELGRRVKPAYCLLSTSPFDSWRHRVKVGGWIELGGGHWASYTEYV